MIIITTVSAVVLFVYSYILLLFLLLDCFIAVADPGFWIRGVKFQKFRPKPSILCNVRVGLHFTWDDWNQYENWYLWKWDSDSRNIVNDLIRSRFRKHLCFSIQQSSWADFFLSLIFFLSFPESHFFSLVVDNDGNEIIQWFLRNIIQI